ncbi:hypothetical protein FDK38_001841 [Candidozyma auris]|nr:hypothetical protein FDK38_001841 [[Candida] auris]
MVITIRTGTEVYPDSIVFHHTAFMTQFMVTDRLKGLIEKSSLSKKEKQRLLAGETISHKDLVSFYRQCTPCPTLLELLRTSKLQLSKRHSRFEGPPKTKEFLESMQRLRLQAKEEEYQRLLNKTKDDPFKLYEEKLDDDWNPAKATKEVRSHLTTIFNIFISVASVIYAIWYWTDTSAGMRDSYRVLLCVFVGLLVLVAEVVVYMGYLAKVEDARVRERNKKEVKKVIQTIKID